MADRMIDSKKIDTTKTRRRIEDALRKKTTPEDLIKVAEVLSVEVALIPEVERPCFGPDQVRCVHQIRKGLEYREIDKDYEGVVFTVVREPFYETKPYIAGWWIEVEHHYGWGKHKNLLSLRDHNIFSYKEGRWNESNWIAFTDKSRHLACHCHGCSCHCHHC